MAKIKEEDPKEDGQKDTCTLYRMVADRTNWNQLVRYVVDTNGQ